MGGAKKIVKSVRKVVKKATPKPLRRIDEGAHKIFIKSNPIAARAVGEKSYINEAVTGKQQKLTPMGESLTASAIEKKAGATPLKYESLRDKQGVLKEQFSYDPTKSAAFSELQKQAMASPDESPWTKMQMQKQAFEEQGLLDQTAKAQAQGMAQAQSNLMRLGGMQGGARQRLASQGAKDLMIAQQNARRAGVSDRLGIGESAIDRQQQALGGVADTELKGQTQNLSTISGDVQGKRDFDLGRYQAQMAAYGANKSADAQVQAAKKSKKK